MAALTKPWPCFVFDTDAPYQTQRAANTRCWDVRDKPIRTRPAYRETVALIAIRPSQAAVGALFYLLVA
jgi:hypothetical protein